MTALRAVHALLVTVVVVLLVLAALRVIPRSYGVASLWVLGAGQLLVLLGSLLLFRRDARKRRS